MKGYSGAMPNRRRQRKPNELDTHKWRIRTDRHNMISQSGGLYKPHRRQRTFQPLYHELKSMLFPAIKQRKKQPSDNKLFCECEKIDCMYYLWRHTWKVATTHMPKQDIIPSHRPALLSLGLTKLVSSFNFSTNLYLEYIVPIPVQQSKCDFITRCFCFSDQKNHFASQHLMFAFIFTKREMWLR